MRANGFTLIELVAVIALLGILAGATAWRMTGTARRGKWAGVINRVAGADRMARLAARQSGEPWALRLDLDKGRIVRACRDDRGREKRGHSLGLPEGFRIDRVILPEPIDDGRDIYSERRIRTADDGHVTIAYSTSGRSMGYAVRLVGPDETTRWLVFAGLTGQVTTDYDDKDIDNLLLALVAGRSDAG